MIQVIEPNNISVPNGAWQLDVDDGSNAPVDALSPQKSNDVVKDPEKPLSESPPPLTTIIESLLFAAAESLHADRICSIIRNLTPILLDQAISDLNQQYQRQSKPYTINKLTTGYRLSLRSRYRSHLEQLYGSIKEARFSQTVIETLAIIAYRQPLSQIAIEAIQGQECSSPLRQLIRRGMIHIEGQDQDHQPLYGTTQRFLEFFQLSKPDDLPHADDLERL